MVVPELYGEQNALGALTKGVDDWPAIPTVALFFLTTVASNPLIVPVPGK